MAEKLFVLLITCSGSLFVFPSLDIRSNFACSIHTNVSSLPSSFDPGEKSSIGSKITQNILFFPLGNSHTYKLYYAVWVT